MNSPLRLVPDDPPSPARRCRHAARLTPRAAPSSLAPHLRGHGLPVPLRLASADASCGAGRIDGHACGSFTDGRRPRGSVSAFRRIAAQTRTPGRGPRVLESDARQASASTTRHTPYLAASTRRGPGRRALTRCDRRAVQWQLRIDSRFRFMTLPLRREVQLFPNGACSANSAALTPSRNGPRQRLSTARSRSRRSPCTATGCRAT